VLVPAEAVLDAVGSPAWGEEGFAPAGFIFAAGVLAFAAAVPAVAFSPLGVPEPAPPPPPAAPPPAASNDETGAAAKASANAKAHDVLFNIIFLLVPHTGATTSLQRGDVELVLSPSTLHADSSGVASDSPGVRGVLGALLWGFLNSKTGCCFRSYEAIAAKARCFRDTVYEAHKVLKNARVLTWGSYIPAV
jgi:hypothetical protein